MNQSTTSDRLTKLCDEAIRRITYIAKLLQQIRSQDASSDNAAKWLQAECCRRAYCGANYEYRMDPIFAELEAMKQPPDDEMMYLGANPGDTEPPQPAA
jgi:hypothetical protein